MNQWLRRLVGPGRTGLVLVTWAVVLAWGVVMIGQWGLVKDLSGRDLPGVRALIAELAPETRVTLVGASPMIALLAPLARESDRLVLRQVALDRLAVSRGGLPAGVRLGDVQVRAGDAWVLLHRPSLEELLGALTLVASPHLRPVRKDRPPLQDDAGAYGLSAPSGTTPGVPAHMRGVAWMLAGVLLPLGLWAAGGWWRGLRRGR